MVIFGFLIIVSDSHPSAVGFMRIYFLPFVPLQELVCIGNQKQNEFVGRETHGETWIGYSLSEDGGWEWAGASCGSTYEGWGAGEALEARAEDCAAIRLFEVIGHCIYRILGVLLISIFLEIMQGKVEWSRRSCGEPSYYAACVGTPQASRNHPQVKTYSTWDYVSCLTLLHALKKLDLMLILLSIYVR